MFLAKKKKWRQKLLVEHILIKNTYRELKYAFVLNTSIVEYIIMEIFFENNFCKIGKKNNKTNS